MAPMPPITIPAIPANSRFCGGPLLEAGSPVGVSDIVLDARILGGGLKRFSPSGYGSPGVRE